MTDMAGSNIKQWEDWSDESSLAERDELEKGGSQFFKFPIGETHLRLLPPPLGSQWGPSGKVSPFRIVYEHFIELTGATSKVHFVCPRYHAQDVCPACDEADRLNKTGNPVDKSRAKKLYPGRRSYVNAIIRGHEHEGVKVIGLSKTVHEGIRAIRDREGSPTDPLNGYDIIITRVGATLTDTKYAVTPARQNSQLDDMDWINQQTDLHSLAVAPSQPELRELLPGLRDPAAARTVGPGARTQTIPARTPAPPPEQRGGFAAQPPMKRASRTAQDEALGDDVPD